MTTEDLEWSDYGRWPHGPKLFFTRLLILFAAAVFDYWLFSVAVRAIWAK